MPQNFTAAVIGCGSIAQHLHLPGYAKRADISRLVGVDPVAERRTEVEGRFAPAATYSDYREMFARERPDFVSVCSPNVFHGEHAVAALQAGAHVLLEKPMTLTLAEAKAVSAAAAAAGKQVMIGFSHRLRQSNQAIKQLLLDGAIGEPFMMRVRFAHGGPFPGWAKSDWFYRPELAGGGALFDMGIHAIDLCEWLIGPITAVTAVMRTLRKPIALDDNAVMAVEFGARALGYIEVGWTSGPGFLGLEIYGDAGTIINDYEAPLRICRGVSSPDMQEALAYAWEEIPVAGGPETWEIEIDHFLDTILAGKDFAMGLDAGAAALAVALAAMDSAKNGRRNVVGVRSQTKVA